MFMILRMVIVCGVLSVPGVKASAYAGIFSGLEEKEEMCIRCLSVVYGACADCWHAIRDYVSPETQLPPSSTLASASPVVEHMKKE